MLTDEELMEELAAIEHQRWADWQRYMHGLCTKNDDGSLTIPPALAERWTKQIMTPYEELSASEQVSDRDQVKRYWHLIQSRVDEDVILTIRRTTRILRKMVPVLASRGMEIDVQAGMLFDLARLDKIADAGEAHGKEPD